ncbi:DUF6233 domain-containing protein [Streptomyces genisteinicus]|uniref:DUF6233 domain-containing protein n=1 Tax=Streptomyces genisteinicus TaxID=2768068 RepID=UPI001FE27645|nr:DUF6233 domain-containing protein [Streptomyces genisteinicus]
MTTGRPVRDLPADADRLRVLELWLQLSLKRVRDRIADLERRDVERRRGAAAAPLVPDWVVGTGIGADRPRLYVHVGGCRMAGTRVHAVTRDVAARAAADGVEACSHCGADAALGVT